MKYFKIIFLYFQISLQSQLANLPIVVMFFVNKLIRYGMFLIFLYFLVSSAGNLGGYTTPQVLFFYLIFNIIDSTVQMLYREVYRFRPMIVSGNLDTVLVKPFPPLLRVLLGGPDFIDLGILLILITLAAYQLIFYIHPSLNNTIVCLVLIFNAFAIATAFHIFVLGLAIITTSVDHMIMVYRDLASLMRVPVDFFSDFLRNLFVFVIPIGVMFTFPAKALYGLLSWQWIVFSLGMGIASMFLALRFWHFALTRYQSASS